MTTERTVLQWLELYNEGPSKEENECRACYHTMTPYPADATEPTVFCHGCAQEMLELLVEEHKRVLQLAKTGWNTARSLAIMGAHNGSHSASERAADKALEELGDA